MMKTAYRWGILVALLAIPTLAGHGEQPKPRAKGDQKLDELMRRKLASSQKVLEGLALADFNVISKHGDELIAISTQAQWQVLKTPQYEVHSNAFRRTAESLVKNAKDKNLDAAALDYLDLTLTCVKCHKYVREVRMTRNGQEDGLRIPAAELAIARKQR